MQDFEGPRSQKTQDERPKRSFSPRKKFGGKFGKKSYRSDSEGLDEHGNQSHENHFGGRTKSGNNYHSSGERSNNSKGHFSHNKDQRFNKENNGRETNLNFSEDSNSENRAQRRFSKPGFKRGGFKRDGASRESFNKGGAGRNSFKKETFHKSDKSYGKDKSQSKENFKKNLLEKYKNNEVQIENPYKEDASVLTSEVRLNKFISNSGKCSRREADTFISAGVVTVNGETITEMGFKVKPGDDVRFNGERIHGEAKVYILMNKPKGFVTSVNDPHASDVVLDLISPELCPQRVYPVGRLDKDTTGVLLFTNDGELTERLTHPSYSKRKIYQADLNKDLTKDDMQRLVDGVELEDGMANVDEISYIDNVKSCIGVEIHNGKNRIVRRLFESLGYKVKKLDRVYFAGMTKKNLKRGQWRFLTKEEVNILKMGAYE